ncbi:MAG: outer membrane protein assembly factor BamD [Bacteroidaceae bacterium]|nr:outer membrane protein assembly factor BamD [Bacteroidaceae bacterium]
MKNTIWLCLLMAIALTSCGEYAALQKTTDYEYRYEAAKQYYMEGKYRKAATLMGDLLGTMKGTAYGEESLFLTAMSEFKAKDYETAGNYFKKYCQSYPKGTYVEQSFYYTGLSLYHQTPDPRLDQQNTDQAMLEIQNFLDKYPNTQLKPQCQDMLMVLQDKLVEKEWLSAKLYYDLGTYTGNCLYGGSNYQACVVTAQNALRDYPYASTQKREQLSFITLKAKYHLAMESVEEKRIERFRDAIDEYYAFENDFPESKHMVEAKNMFRKAENIVKKKKIDLTDED